MKYLLKIVLIISIGFISISAQAIWQCTVANPIKKQMWIGVGPTRAGAVENAIKFCAYNSTYVKNCHVQGCFQK